MQVLKLIRQHNCFIKDKIGKEIGKGADGQCFDLIDRPHQVIKFSVIYDLDFKNNLHNKYYELTNSLEFVKKNNPNPFVKLYDYGMLYSGVRETVHGTQDFLIHYAVMEKLEKITEDEKKVFHSLLSREEKGRLPYSKEQLLVMLKNMARGLDFEEKNIILFCEGLQNSPLLHNDIHVDIRGVRNIMKYKTGQFKLVDLDRLSIKNKEL